MSIIQPTAGSTRSTLDFQVPAPAGGGRTWAPTSATMVAKVARAAVSKYDLLTFDLPPTLGARRIGTFDRTHPFNFVRPHSETTGSGSEFATGTLTTTVAPVTEGERYFFTSPKTGALYQIVTSSAAIPINPGPNGRVIDITNPLSVSQFLDNLTDAYNDLKTGAQAGDHGYSALFAIPTPTDITFIADEPGTFFNNNTIVETMSDTTATQYTSGVDGGDVPIYAVALEDGAVGERIQVQMSGIARVKSESGVLDGDIVVATSGLATVTRLDTVANSPRLVLGRSHGGVVSASGEDHDSTVLMVFNGLYGCGVTGVEYS